MLVDVKLQLLMLRPGLNEKSLEGLMVYVSITSVRITPSYGLKVMMNFVAVPTSPRKFVTTRLR